MAQKSSQKRIFAETDTGVGNSRHKRRFIPAVMRRVRSKFGVKAALELALRADADQRSGERWLAGKSMNAENFAALLRSDIGIDVLDATMGDNVQAWPAWYVALRRQHKLSTLRRAMAAQQRELEALEREATS